MTKEILVINPKRKPRRRKTGLTRRRNANGTFAKMRRARKPARRSRFTASAIGGRTMPTRRKRTTRKRRTPTRSIRKAVTARRRRSTPRRNPTRRAAAARRAGSALKNVLNMKNVIEAAQGTGGMLATQFFAKKFAAGGGANDSDWTWKNYTWGAVGAVASGLGASLISNNAGKEFFKGGLSLLMYKLVVNEWAEKSDFISEYFGAGETVFMGSDGNAYSPGDTYLGDDGEVYLMGQDGTWKNAYVGPETALGGTVAAPTNLGGTVAMPTSLGADPYANVFAKGGN